MDHVKPCFKLKGLSFIFKSLKSLVKLDLILERGSNSKPSVLFPEPWSFYFCSFIIILVLNCGALAVQWSLILNYFYRKKNSSTSRLSPLVRWFFPCSYCFIAIIMIIIHFAYISCTGFISFNFGNQCRYVFEDICYM